VTRKPQAGQLERLIESALHPGRFVPDRDGYSFAREVGAVEEQIARLVSTDPVQAAALYETFLAGCYEKANEVDDSSGSFGQFIVGLFCGWIRARRAAGADPDETARRLVRWMEDDPFGFCYGMEKDAAEALDKVGLEAFVRQIRGRFEAAAPTQPGTGGPLERNPDRARRRWAGTLRTLHLAQKDVAAYQALAEETGLSAEDCLALATMLVARRRPQDALEWAERGIELATKARHGWSAGQDLAKLRRDLLAKLGRGEEALDAAWAEYLAHPSKYTYDGLMTFVPKVEQKAWHEKAIEAAMGSDLHSLIELLLETSELERLAALVRQTKDEALEGESHYTTEPAAKKLEESHPDLAARLWCAQGLRLVKGKKSKYYDAALSNFERARRCFERAGLLADWQRLVVAVRSEHQRKAGFMAGFEVVVAGSGPSEEPSFLDRAKARWGHGRRPGGGG